MLVRIGGRSVLNILLGDLDLIASIFNNIPSVKKISDCAISHFDLD